MYELDKITEEIIRMATEAGADKAYCSAAESEKREFNADGGEFSLMRTLFDRALTLTVIVDGKRGSVGINRLDREAMEGLVSDAVSLARAGERDDAFDVAPYAGEHEFTEGAPDGDIDRLFDRSEELLRTIGERYPKIIVEQMIVSHDRSRRVYRNTSGSVFRTLRGAYSAELMYSAHEGEQSTSFFSTGAVTEDLDTPFIELARIDRDIADVEAQLDPIKLEGKLEGTVLMPPSCLESFISDIAGCFASDSVMLDGTSIWKDSLKEQVADPRITLRIDPFAPEIVCGERYTSEGFLSEPYYFIKNGVLESFMLSLYAANKTGCERAKNSSFSLVMDGGDETLESIVSGIERGLLVGRFSGGETGASGDFSGVAKNSFLIENGKLTKPVSEVMISGNLASLLKNVRGISKERVCDGTSVLPYAAFDGVTIAGQ